MLRFLISDALADFRTLRGPTTAEYVQRRYGNGAHSDDFIKRKTRSVEARKALANKLHNAALYPRYEEFDETEVTQLEAAALEEARRALQNAHVCCGDDPLTLNKDPRCICSCHSTVQQSTR